MRRSCTAGPAFVGLCRTQETSSGAVPAQQYLECSEEHTISISIQGRFTSERTNRLPAVTHIISAARASRSAGSRALACALCIASGHAARAKGVSAFPLQPLGWTSALQVTGLNKSRSSAAGPQMGHSLCNGLYLFDRLVWLWMRPHLCRTKL